MGRKDKIYRELQKYFNKQPIGFPATISGIELKILKRFFTPDEARLTMKLDYKPQSVESIYEKIKDTGISPDELSVMLENMLQKGTIEFTEREGVRYYRVIPFVVGWYESQVNNLTPAFVEEYEQYTAGKSFGLEFINTGLSQFRTIPVRQSIKVERLVTNYDHLTDIINNTDGPIVVQDCICRKKAGIKGNPCKQTNRMETCMAFGYLASNIIARGIGREIDREEALEIARQNEADGLVLQPSNSQKIEFICACCGCCCDVLQAHLALPKPVDFWNTNHYSEVNPDTCNGCGVCENRCQVNAISVDHTLKVASVNRDKCLGCGNCVTFCPIESISLIKKETEHVPPADFEVMYDTIKENKRGNLGKLKIVASIMLKR